MDGFASAYRWAFGVREYLERTVSWLRSADLAYFYRRRRCVPPLAGCWREGTARPEKPGRADCDCGMTGRFERALLRLEELGAVYFDGEEVPRGWLEVLKMQDGEGPFTLAIPEGRARLVEVEWAMKRVRAVLTFPT